ncbi:hypothetical protein BSKO_09969 [Bryopsis sp. KO-2023]|nr:hypothetical protein BSKO_09969 [Bryopsis sp. KO-2023]
MFIVCGTAVSQGNYNRLVYGYDSQGFLCGTDNSFLDGETGPDLRNNKRLYYLNALELLDPLNFKAAKSICVAECPGEASKCGLGEVCSDADQFRCPYYRVAGDNLYGSLGGADGVSKWNTSYYDELATTTSSNCSSLLSVSPTTCLKPEWWII